MKVSEETFQKQMSRMSPVPDDHDVLNWFNMDLHRSCQACPGVNFISAAAELHSFIRAETEGVVTADGSPWLCALFFSVGKEEIAILVPPTCTNDDTRRVKILTTRITPDIEDAVCEILDEYRGAIRRQCMSG